MIVIALQFGLKFSSQFVCESHGLKQYHKKIERFKQLLEVFEPKVKKLILKYLVVTNINPKRLLNYLVKLMTANDANTIYNFMVNLR